MTRNLAALLLLTASLAPAAQNPAPNPADACTVQGVVIKVGTGEPLKKANVELWVDNGDGQRHDASTDSMGRFEIKNVEPGRYRLSVQRNGYVRQEYGQTKPGGSGSYLSLSSGQTVSNITLQMIPAAVITGHVYDEDGDPVQGAEVFTLQSVYMNGQRDLARAGEARTDDQGAFRIYGLSPGQYLLEANKQPRMLSDLKSDPGYVPVYYPGVYDPSTATPITVQAGDEFSSADINLRTTQTATVRGHAVASGGGGPATYAQVYLVTQASPASSSHVVSETPVVNPQGSFEVRNVAPGSYYLYAYALGSGRAEFARQPIEVAGTDLDGINLTLTPGVTLRGRVHVEGNLEPSAGSFQVTLAPKNTVVMFNGMPNAPVRPDGSFELKSVFDGDYELYIEGLPANDFVKSARWGGLDTLAGGIHVDTAPSPGPLDIVVSPNGARINGTVSNDNQPFPGARVTLVPDPPHRGEGGLFMATSTDQFGHFVLQGISPGDYKLFAWESIEAGAYKSPDFLLPFESQGQSVHVAEGNSQSVQLELIPAKDSGQ